MGASSFSKDSVTDRCIQILSRKIREMFAFGEPMSIFLLPSLTTVWSGLVAPPVLCFPSQTLSIYRSSCRTSAPCAGWSAVTAGMPVQP